MRIRTIAAFAIMRLPMPRTWRPFFARLGGVRAGKRVFIGRGVSFDTMYPSNIVIEDDVHITDNCTFLTHCLDTSAGWIVWKEGHIRICRKAFIGTGTIITKSCTIGEFSVVGAGSVVTRDIPPGEIWAGNPAVFLKRRNK